MSEELAIVLFTYRRMDYAEATLRALLDLIHYERGPISVVIADDGSGGNHAETLRQIAGGYAKVKTTAVTDAQRGGYGRSYNLASQVTHASATYVLPIEDDWVLQRPLDVEHFLPAFEELDIGCIRLGYLGFTDTLRGYVAYAGHEHYLVFDPTSREKHVFAGHPRLETVEWEKSVGPWVEGLSPGATELAVCGIANARRGVAWPLDAVKPRGDLFHHIGAVRSY